MEGKTIRQKKNYFKTSFVKAERFSIVLECLDTNLSKIITKSQYPTIGIGASANCDGQILVTDDLLGLSGFYPKFVKKNNLRKIIKKAVSKYKKSKTK